MPEPVLIQPVEGPVICKPYYEPTHYWEYGRTTGRAAKQLGTVGHETSMFAVIRL